MISFKGFESFDWSNASHVDEHDRRRYARELELFVASGESFSAEVTYILTGDMMMLAIKSKTDDKVEYYELTPVSHHWSAVEK